MSSCVIYEEITLSDVEFASEEQCFLYPCPCGDQFVFYIEDLENGDCIATCPSCSLNIKLCLEEGELSVYLAAHAK